MSIVSLQEAVDSLLTEAPSRKRKDTPSRGKRGTKVDYWRTMPSGHRIGFRKAKAGASKGKGYAVTGYAPTRNKLNKGVREESQEQTRKMEATITGAIPMIPHPLEYVGPFSEAERKNIVRRLQSIFPGAEESAITRAVFGNHKPITE